MKTRVEIEKKEFFYYRDIIKKQLANLSNKLKDIKHTPNLKNLIQQIDKLENYNALLFYLVLAIQEEPMIADLPILNDIVLYTNLKTEQCEQDKRNNPYVAAVFESELAYHILRESPKDCLKTVNESICNYLNKYKQQLDDTVIKKQLVKYKICQKNDFETTNPIDKLIDLLSRELTPQHISECFTLHLLFFNYEHIYKPESDCQDHHKEAIKQSRIAIHKQLRPKEKGDMFDPDIRGRESQSAKKPSKKFGIVKAKLLPAWAEEWHHVEFTPYKYRAKANPRSPIVQTFRKAGVPFIAGPSGTTADCLEGLHFCYPNWIKRLCKNT